MQYVYLVATSFCMFVWKMWAREELCLNDSKKICTSTFKAIYKCSITLSYGIGKFSRNIFLHFRMQKLWTREKLCTNDSNKISKSIFIAIYTCSIILSYEIGEFHCNSFLYVHMQNYELVKNCARMIQTRYQI